MDERLLGRRAPMTDLMAWNADATRMPYRMHGEYLRRCFLDNDLFEGRYTVDGRAIVLGDIRMPLFVVATERDHVSPWRSVYQIKLVADTEVSVLLTSGGHNAGIVSEPSHAGRRYRYTPAHKDEHYLDPDSGFAATPATEGSWWPCWAEWLEARSSGQNAAPGSRSRTPAAPAFIPPSPREHATWTRHSWADGSRACRP
ncbi:alpha/beta hydrolase [Nitrogeniibacter mangrovi]|uniref:Alpha/beta hydrolase n=1 Tax=Nitrogeniibacter mangrovi TaxID=2016596 RepID=A0A6C1AZN0_9RHOO|nr:alpha/beta hydrolase [Nitrogeniibacter mangrovi]QID16812.1 alpha/beta hydrolase [Nitrogeniibacter mangrovi]